MILSEMPLLEQHFHHKQYSGKPPEMKVFTKLLCVSWQSLNMKRSALREVQDKLARLQEKYEANVKKKADLEKQVWTFAFQ